MFPVRCLARISEVSPLAPKERDGEGIWGKKRQQ